MVKIGEIEVPIDYFNLPDEDKKQLVKKLYEGMYETVDKMATPGYNRTILLYQIIQSSVITNRLEENYEICQILTDVEKYMDEQTN